MIKRIIDKKTNLFIRDDFTFDESIEIGLDVEPAQGFYQPKWNGEAWEEGATQEYINSLKAQAEPQEPTEAERLEERVQAVETKTVALEETLGVLFG